MYAVEASKLAEYSQMIVNANGLDNIIEIINSKYYLIINCLYSIYRSCRRCDNSWKSRYYNKWMDGYLFNIYILLKFFK